MAIQVEVCPNEKCKAPVFVGGECSWCVSCGERFSADFKSRLLEKIKSQSLVVRAEQDDCVPFDGSRASFCSKWLCLGLGMAFLGVGAYFLLINPAADSIGYSGKSVVNLQSLFIGQTSSIIGAIFMAAGIRPR